MFQISTTEATLVLGAGTLIGIYCLLASKKNSIVAPSVPVNSKSDTSADIIPKSNQHTSSSGPPISLPPFFTGPDDPEEIDDEVEWLDDDLSLLREAEIVVDNIQESINQHTSAPFSKEEITAKLSDILSPYSLFLDTDYFDSINAYISIALERDCNLQLSIEEIKALWG